jgi:chemotaxis protein CheD
MLPDSGIDPGRARANPFVFADTGIPRLIEHVLGRGASKRRLVAAAAGAARLLDPEGLFEIGRRNHQAARRVLWKAGILLHREAVGGNRSRSMRLEIGTGRLWLLENGEIRDLIPASPRKGGTPWPSAS